MNEKEKLYQTINKTIRGWNKIAIIGIITYLSINIIAIIIFIIITILN